MEPEKLDDSLPIYYMTAEDISMGTFAVSLVDEPAIQESFIALSAHGERNELMMAAANAEKRIVTGPVLIPNKAIYRELKKQGYYILFSEEVVEASRNKFARDHGNMALTHQHLVDMNGRAYVVEQWIIEDPERDKAVALGLTGLPKGTWMMSVRVEDPEYWQNEVKGNKVTGFSIEGFYGHAIAEADKQIKASRKQRSNPVAALLRKAADLLEGAKPEPIQKIELMEVFVTVGEETVAVMFPETEPFELPAIDADGKEGKVVFMPTAAAGDDGEDGMDGETEMRAQRVSTSRVDPAIADAAKEFSVLLAEEVSRRVSPLEQQLKVLQAKLNAKVAPGLPAPVQDRNKTVELTIEQRAAAAYDRVKERLNQNTVKNGR